MPTLRQLVINLSQLLLLLIAEVTHTATHTDAFGLYLLSSDFLGGDCALVHCVVLLHLVGVPVAEHVPARHVVCVSNLKLGHSAFFNHLLARESKSTYRE